jgi:hypothetical protein
MLPKGLHFCNHKDDRPRDAPDQVSKTLHLLGSAFFEPIDPDSVEFPKVHKPCINTWRR